MATRAMLLMTSSPGSIAQPWLGILLQPIPKTIEFFAHLRLNLTEFCRIEFSILRPALCEKVILDLVFCPGWTHGDARSIFQFRNRHPFSGTQAVLALFDHLLLDSF